MKAPLQTLRTHWAVIALAVAGIAIVAGVSYGLRTSNGIGAQAPPNTPVIPPSLEDTPTTEETRDIIGTAEAVSKEEAALDAAYKAATAKYPRSIWPHVQIPITQSTTLTPNLQEYLNTHPGRAIYLRTIDKVLHLPKNIKLRYVQGGVFPLPQCFSSGCDWWPSYDIALKDSNELLPHKRAVSVESTGTVEVRRSDTLPDGFSFLSEFKIERVER